ncbi:MAG: hypothetical protein KME15_16270 [Drouetiella hepatica Uher 2000/2452]|uniref:Uncharacterized protein n=1 Tax=Drouetiella hepatica Uher 2000/2452 TaxID=904376 RepID=A0A951UN03_9CYAN|nr:hypothetical protein [Drouetiella hepatica Uher 2000/2452]
MTAQDFLTALSISTLIFSVLNFGLLFVIGMADRSRLLSQTAKLPHSPTPTIALPALILPSISVNQADQNLDSQLRQIAQLDQVATDSRLTAIALRSTAKKSRKTTTKAKTLNKTSTASL